MPGSVSVADLVGISAVQPVAAADGPHERGVPLDEVIPRWLVAVCGPYHQARDRPVIAHSRSVPSASGLADTYPRA